jgi:hypothetical protein
MASSLLLTVIALAVVGWYLVIHTKSGRPGSHETAGKAPMVPYKLPFGLDMLWEAITVCRPRKTLTR